MIINTLKKVLFSDDKNTQHVHNICCSCIKVDMWCNFIVMILTRTGLHKFVYSLIWVFWRNQPYYWKRGQLEYPTTLLGDGGILIFLVC